MSIGEGMSPRAASIMVFPLRATRRIASQLNNELSVSAA
jgi:hypothetical protein